MKAEKKLFINGHWREPKEYYELQSPYSRKVIAKVPLAKPEEVEAALSSAEKATKVMRSLSALERAQILENASDLFKKRLKECAAILTKENAKPMKAAKAEINRTIETYKFAAEEAKRIHGETIPMDAAASGKGRFAYTKREPLGVIAAITPFNFPFNLVAHKLGPAIATGNTMVLKPAYQTPLSALITAEIFQEAGLPDGALNVITGKGSTLGDQLVQDDRVKMVTFTGSVEVGKAIRKKAGLKKTTLELGSNSGVVIDSTDDLDDVAKRCVQGAYTYAGQICISVQRIYVKKELYQEFLQKFISYAENLVLGDPESEKTDVSSLIHPNENKRVEQWIKEAVDSGAELILGGSMKENVYEPTILTRVSNHLSVSCQEVFAPLVVIDSYDSWDEAIDLVNDSRYGLQAGVFTTSIQKAFDAANRMVVGGVMINEVPTFRVDQMPYGGMKESGTGREGIPYSVEEMTEMKMVSFKL